MYNTSDNVTQSGIQHVASLTPANARHSIARQIAGLGVDHDVTPTWPQVESLTGRPGPFRLVLCPRHNIRCRVGAVLQRLQQLAYMQCIINSKSCTHPLTGHALGIQAASVFQTIVDTQLNKIWFMLTNWARVAK